MEKVNPGRKKKENQNRVKDDPEGEGKPGDEEGPPGEKEEGQNKKEKKDVEEKVH